MAVIDHLVYAVPDLSIAIDRLDEQLGVRAVVGGAHPGMGTHNALLSFGRSYLEIIAPDPGQPEPANPRPFGIDDLDEPRLVTFAARPGAGESIDGLIMAMRAAGHDPGEPMAMSRRTPAGAELHWTLTMPTLAADGCIPFLIDWGDTPNPSTTTPTGVRLLEMTGATSRHEFANGVLDAIGLAPMVGDGDRGPSAIIDGAIGTVPLTL